MPKRPTDKQGTPHKGKCYESRHLSAAHFKVYHVVRNCAWHWREQNGGKGPLIFNASVEPWLCNAVPISKNYARAILDELVELGWMKQINDKPIYNKDKKKQAPNEYEVFEHDDFVAVHPDSCPRDLYAPDQQTAADAGVGYGERVGVEPLPKNFWPQEPILRSALEKITGEVAVVMTEEESVALGKHLTAIKPATAVPVTGSYRSSGHAGTAVQDDQVPQLRLVSGKASVTTPTHTPQTPSAGVSVCEGQTLGEGLPMAEEEEPAPEPFNEGKFWDALLNAFAKQEYVNHEAALTPRQRKDITALRMKHGPYTFKGAVYEWFKAQPWNPKTLFPWGTFIANFEMYAGAAKRREEALGIRNSKEELIKAANELARQRHVEFWTNPPGTGTAEDLLKDDDK
jgi:hypothetical protein